MPEISPEPQFPSCMETSLKMLRRSANPDDSEWVKQFLVATSDAPDDCVVRLSEGRAALVTDDEGRLLSFA